MRVAMPPSGEPVWLEGEPAWHGSLVIAVWCVALPLVGLGLALYLLLGG